MVMKKHAAFAAFALLCLSATLLAQNINALTAQERAQGWQLLFDGKTLAGWHVSAAAQAQAGPERSATAAAARAGGDAEAMCRSRHAARRREVRTGKSWMDC